MKHFSIVKRIKGSWIAIVFRNRLPSPTFRLYRRSLLLLLPLCFLLFLLTLSKRPPLAPVSSNDVRVFSAYLDPRLGVVRVIAAAKVSPLPLLFCLWPSSVTRPLPASVSALMDKPSQDYNALFIDCPLPSASPPPRFVAVSTNASGPASFMRITNLPAAPPHSPTIGACVCPLHGDDQRVSVRHMTAWIEMNRLLGVQHFVFYNYSAPPSLRPLFRHYSRLGVVELLPWRLEPLPVAEVGSWPPPKSQLHYFGQFVAFNECLYRMLHRFRFVMFADLDELLVPTQPTSLSQFLNNADSWFISAFSFRGSYLRSDFPEEKGHQDILFLKRAVREKRVLEWHLAPKLVVKPHRVLRMGIHEVVEHYPSFWKLVRHISPEDGLLMHYRDPPAYLRQPDAGVRDTRVVHLREKLLKRMLEVIGRVEMETATTV